MSLLILVCVLFQNTQISEITEFRKSYIRDLEKKDDLKEASFQLWCYAGDLDNPKWKDQDIGEARVFFPSFYAPVKSDSR